MPEFNQISELQQFEWGTILWFIEPNDMDIERMSAGVITFYPNTVQEEHLHSVDEQVIYVVSGTGTHIIDGQDYPLKPGEIKHISPYTRHKVINDSLGELKLLIVYTPSKFQRLLTQPANQQISEETNIRTFLDYELIGNLLNKLSEAIDLSLAIIDTQGEFIVKTDNYPVFCDLLTTVSQGNHCGQNIKRIYQEIGRFSKPQLFLCCSNIASIIIPIFHDNAVIGYIKCGQVFLSKPESIAVFEQFTSIAGLYNISREELVKTYLQIKVEPKSRLYAAAEATFAIANCITDMAAAVLRQKELDNSRLSLIKEQIATTKLEKALREADFKLLQSQIQPHFLFNTLNMIAQMAYVEGTEKVANLIWSLSDLLRFTLRKSEELIPLQEEISMLNNYIHIQLSRFGDRLQIVLDVEDGLENALVPCMLLQPLVENAIIHGFELGTKKGLVTVLIQRAGDYVQCCVSDNGLGFNAVTAEVESKNSIGLNSVRNRLQYYFKENHQFRIESQLNEGTKILLSFPLIGGNGDA